MKKNKIEKYPINHFWDSKESKLIAVETLKLSKKSKFNSINESKQSDGKQTESKQSESKQAESKQTESKQIEGNFRTVNITSDEHQLFTLFVTVDYGS